MANKNSKVALNSLGLFGRIGGNNSYPYISSANVDRIRRLDNYMKQNNLPYTITSSMGGSHAGGIRGHGSGQKLDIVADIGKLGPQHEQWLTRNGFYGGGTGALGYHDAGSGPHYDFYVGDPTNPYNSAIIAPNGAGGIMIDRQNPDLLYPGQQLQGVAGATNANQAQIYQDLLNRNAAIANKYNLAGIRNDSMAREQALTNNAVNAANAQMFQNRVSPAEQQELLLNSAIANQLAINNAQDINDAVIDDYNTRRSPEEMQAIANQNINNFLDKAKAENLLLRMQQDTLNGNGPKLQFDPRAYQNAVARDNTLKSYMAARALMDARVNPQRAQIAAQLANQGGNQAQQYANTADILYKMQIAQQYGIPYEALVKANEQQQNLYKEMAPGVSSLSKETVLQPERNFIAAAQNFPKEANKAAENQVNASNMLLTGLNNLDTQNIKYNTPAVDIIKKGHEVSSNMLDDYNTNVVKKMEGEQKLLNSLAAPTMQGITSVGTNLSTNLTNAANNYNTNTVNLAEQDAMDRRKEVDAQIEQQRLLQKAEEARLKAEGKANQPGNFNKVIQEAMKYVYDENGNKYPADVLKTVLLNSGVEPEVAAQIVAHYYPELFQGTSTGQAQPAGQGGSAMRDGGYHLDKNGLPARVNPNVIVGPDVNTVQKTIQTQPLTQQQNEELLNTLNPTQRLNMLMNGQMVSTPKGYGVR